jgi:hypothetical protein
MDIRKANRDKKYANLAIYETPPRPKSILFDGPTFTVDGSNFREVQMCESNEDNSEFYSDSDLHDTDFSDINCSDTEKDNKANLVIPSYSDSPSEPSEPSYASRVEWWQTFLKRLKELETENFSNKNEDGTWKKDEEARWKIRVYYIVLEGIRHSSSALRAFSLCIPCCERVYDSLHDVRLDDFDRDAYNNTLSWIATIGLSLQDMSILIGHIRAFLSSDYIQGEYSECLKWVVSSSDITSIHVNEFGRSSYVTVLFLTYDGVYAYIRDKGKDRIVKNATVYYNGTFSPPSPNSTNPSFDSTNPSFDLTNPSFEVGTLERERFLFKYHTFIGKEEKEFSRKFKSYLIVVGSMECEQAFHTYLIDNDRSKLLNTMRYIQNSV